MRRSDNYEPIIFTSRVNYMAGEAPNYRGRFIEVGWGFHDLPVCSEVFPTPRRMMLKKVLEDVG
jgi:hypothetical protein